MASDTNNGSNTVLVEIDESHIEGTPSGMMLLPEPLKDHNYVSTQTSKTNSTERTKKKIIRKKPKITSLTLLFKCTVCGYATTKKEVIEKHKETHTRMPRGTVYVPCKSCNVNQNIPRGYKKCPHCSYTAKTDASLKVHKHIHDSGTGYKCIDCAFNGKDVKALVNHIKTAKSYVCDSCSFSSHDQRKVLDHQTKHARIRDEEIQIDSTIEISS